MRAPWRRPGPGGSSAARRPPAARPRPPGTRARGVAATRAPRGYATVAARRRRAGRRRCPDRRWGASSLAVACRAGRPGVNVVALQEVLRQRDRIAFGRPAHGRDLVERTEVWTGVAVAVEAPAHGERRHLLHGRHLIDATVTALAAHALVHVDGVVEVDEVGQPVDPHPRDGLAGEVALPDRLEPGALVPDLRVAVHAERGRRDAGRGPAVDARVAVPAVNAIIGDVVAVVEQHRLDERVLLPGPAGHPRPHHEAAEGADRAPHEQQEHEVEGGVGTGSEERAHGARARPTHSSRLELARLGSGCRKVLHYAARRSSLLGRALPLFATPRFLLVNHHLPWWRWRRGSAGPKLEEWK